MSRSRAPKPPSPVYLFRRALGHIVKELINKSHLSTAAECIKIIKKLDCSNRYKPRRLPSAGLGFPKGASLARGSATLSAPLAGFFWYFSCRSKKSTYSLYYEYKKLPLMINQRELLFCIRSGVGAYRLSCRPSPSEHPYGRSLRGPSRRSP